MSRHAVDTLDNSPRGMNGNIGSSSAASTTPLSHSPPTGATAAGQGRKGKRQLSFARSSDGPGVCGLVPEVK